MARFDFDNPVHLYARHQDLARDTDFEKWHRLHGIGTWHETHPRADGTYDVIIQARDDLSIFAALYKREDVTAAADGALKSSLLKTAVFDLTSDPPLVNYHTAIGKVRADTDLDASVLAIRPAVDWAKEKATLIWEVDLLNNSKGEKRSVEKFFVLPSGRIERSDVFQVIESPVSKQKNLPFVRSFISDSLEENELHHLNQYRATALSWTQGAVSIQDKAFSIWLNIRQRMVYDANITSIAEFTWSDSLVIDTLRYRGICDEWAVLQITMLRALGIPAGMKFIIWTDSSNKSVGHACLEWFDGIRWRHMDALWNAMDDPSVYRSVANARNLTVMDATFPRDSRSSEPAWGVADPIGDLRLHPYGDYIIEPGYPGNSRPGYSY